MQDPVGRMARPEPDSRALSRRRFLAGLGVLAGGGAIGAFAARPREARASSVEVTRTGLGTWIRMVVVHPDRERALESIESAFAAIRRVDDQMSVHRSDSQLARVNAAAGREALRVDADLIAVVARARDTAERSGGVYDPTVLPLMRLWGFYGGPLERLPGTRAIDAALARVGFGAIAIDRAAGTLGLTREGAALDLGSIGKGWAVDRAVAALRRSGVRNALVDVGGNVYGLGAPDETSPGWSVGLFHPVTHRLERTFVLRDAAVATSANTEQFRIVAGLRIGHLLDAKRGRPADGHLSATVLSASGVASDAGSTAAFLLGPTRFAGWPEVTGFHFVG